MQEIYRHRMQEEDQRYHQAQVQSELADIGMTNRRMEEQARSWEESQRWQLKEALVKLGKIESATNWWGGAITALLIYIAYKLS